MVTSTITLITELEDALNSGSPEKRVETLRRVTGLFLNEADRLNEQQISVFDDVLVHLVQRIESKALVQLSTSLAPVDNAPIETIRNLARNDEIAIAGPVLTQSTPPRRTRSRRNCQVQRPRTLVGNFRALLAY